MYYSKTPLEAKLEREVEQLKAKVQWLEQGMDRGSHSARYAPDTIAVLKLPATVKLPLAVTFGWADKASLGGYHVYAKERASPGMVAGYFANYAELNYRHADRARILQDCLEKATRDLQSCL